MSFAPKGIVVPIVTPITADGQFDEKAYRGLIDYLAENGIHGVFPFGTTGEFYAFDLGFYKHLLEVTKDAVAGRMDIYAGANDITTEGTAKIARAVEEVGGIDALSVLTPMFVSQTQDELYAHYRSVAESTSLPIIMYNNKPKTNVTIAPETVARLAHDCENIVAVKDSTGDMTNSEEYLRLTEDVRGRFNVLLGRDTLIFAGLMYGASGAIASCANVAPRLCADIYDKWEDGDYEGARRAQFTLAPLRIACNMGTFPQTIKEALVMEGLPVGKCLDPIQELTAQQKQKLHDVLTGMKLI